jgi:phosphoribosylglycinamide formyltransferase 1
MTETNLKAAFLISGSGSTAEAVIKASQSGELTGIEPSIVISSRANARGLERARALGIPTEIILRNDFGPPFEFGDAILELFDQHEVDMFAQLGLLIHIPENVVERYKDWSINQHPGDPARFGGRLMFGQQVHRAVLACNWVAEIDNPQTQSTIQFVGNIYDSGKPIRVEYMDIPKLDYPTTIDELRADPEHLIETAKLVASNLLPIEHSNVIASLQMFADAAQRGETVKPLESNPIITTEKEWAIVAKSKQLAKDLYNNPPEI